MNLFTNPAWIDAHNYPYKTLDEVPQSVFDAINARLDARATTAPIVSILIGAYNEEVNVLRCVSSLSALETSTPYEIIIVNNNSTDRTQETLDKLHVRSLVQPIQGCGPARQMAQEAAVGKYILLADADCLYPANWLNEMLKKLQQPGVSCVYGRYSFIATPEISRWQLAVHERLKDTIASFRHVKRPYLNAYGMSMAYEREAGMKIGFVMRHVRGEDGRMCFDLMQYGRVVQMKKRSARVWTPPRTLLLEGTLWQAMLGRIRNELTRLTIYTTRQAPHDTKTSDS